jgi:GNAT superfamily N-acetyltransferase
MNDALLSPSDADLVLALEANLHAHLPHFGKMPRSTFWEEPGLKAVITELDPTECHVYLTQVTPRKAEATIRRVLKFYRAQGCLPMYWQVGASTRPANLGKALERLGFRLFARSPGMAAELAQLEDQPARAANFKIEPVRNENQLRQWVAILATVDGLRDALRDGFYEMFHGLGLAAGSSSQLFLGLEDGEPVAGSRLFCAAGVAGIWHVSTLEQSRGKGYGTTMTLAAARAGQEMGYHYGVLFATPLGEAVYRRLGFREVCHIAVYQSPE